MAIGLGAIPAETVGVLTDGVTKACVVGAAGGTGMGAAAVTGVSVSLAEHAASAHNASIAAVRRIMIPQMQSDGKTVRVEGGVIVASALGC